jgi:hypothetical protein
MQRTVHPMSLSLLNHGSIETDFTKSRSKSRKSRNKSRPLLQAIIQKAGLVQDHLARKGGHLREMGPIPMLDCVSGHGFQYLIEKGESTR